MTRPLLARSLAATAASLALVATTLLSAGAAQAAGPPVPPVQACTDLATLVIPASQIGLPTSGATVTSAVLVPATATVPEYCRVNGQIAPATGAYEINFGVALPTSWQRTAWQFGGGGLNGSVPDLVNAGYAIPGSPSPLAQGAVTYGSDSGHASSDPVSWVLDEEAWRNFAYEQINKTHDAAFAVVQAYYGLLPEITYWHGGSQGGREGLEAATRYPDDYDGVVSWVPLAYFSTLLWNPGWQGQQQYNIGPGGYIPPAKAPALQSAVLDACDGLDGLADGVINDYYTCSRIVDPTVTPDTFAELRCAGGADTGNDCYSDDQLRALAAFYGPTVFPYALANGENTWPGWAGGMENQTPFGTPPIPPFLGPWMFSQNPPSTSPTYYGGGAGAGLGGAAIREWLSGGDPSYSLVGDLDLAAQQTRIQELSELMDVPDDLSGYIGSGGKLIMVTDASDSIANPRAQMRLYDAWVTRHGQAGVDAAVRYYVAPHQGHAPGGTTDASGAVIAGGIDTVSMIQAWVDAGTTPPDSPGAVAVASSFPGPPADTSATKPLCRYPLYPRYTSGDAHAASSYACTLPASLTAAAPGAEDEDGPILPPTGAESGPAVVLAVVLLALGGLAVARRRRPSRS